MALFATKNKFEKNDEILFYLHVTPILVFICRAIAISHHIKHNSSLNNYARPVVYPIFRRLYTAFMCSHSPPCLCRDFCLFFVINL